MLPAAFPEGSSIGFAAEYFYFYRHYFPVQRRRHAVLSALKAKQGPMKKFFKLVGIVLLLAIVFVLVAGLFIRKEYHFERSVTIRASREEIWKNISSFSSYQKWDPFGAHDPNMQKTITGTDGTVGAVYRWKDNKEVGNGSMTYREIVPYDHIKVDLVMVNGMESKAVAVYTLKQEGDHYRLTWSFDTRMPYPMNAVISLFMDMDKMMDREFSNGLANLKKLCESNATFTAFRWKGIMRLAVL